MQQWLIYRSWSTEGIHRPDGSAELRICFTIENPTEYPLTPRHVQFEVRRKKEEIFDKLILGPKRQRSFVISVDLSADDVRKRMDGALVLIVMCVVEFESVLKTRVVWPMSGLLRCSQQQAEFTPESITLDK